MIYVYNDATRAYRALLTAILKHGRRVAPRGIATYELPFYSTAFRMSYPVVYSEARKPSYRFMAAEPLWILSGSDRVDEIAPYNKRMREFSDNGFTLFGAYGPRIASGIDYVVRTLSNDRDSRQAIVSLWRREIETLPTVPKDVPCTVALSYQIRDRHLDAFVMMRSSDAWLGVPYDWFTFSVVAAKILALYNHDRPSIDRVRLGTLYFVAASEHLYEANVEDAARVAAETVGFFGERIPHTYTADRHGWYEFETDLVAAREKRIPDADRWRLRP